METIALPPLPARKADSHKGDYGKVLVIAGSANMIGAPAIVAMAALRTGSGLCRIATPKEILPQVLTICPFATGFPWSLREVKAVVEFAEEHDAVAMGPGLGESPAVKKLLLELLQHHAGPMVLDADALNTLATLQESEWPKRRNWGNVVLTPHMGEFMRLMGAVMKRGGQAGLTRADGNAGQGVTSLSDAKPISRPAADADEAPSTADGVALDLKAAEKGEAEPKDGAADSPKAAAGPDHSALAELLSRGTGTVVVLKGHHTIVTDAARFYTNNTGNPGMATAGSGDVLAGVIASLLGQRFSALEAAALGVHLHGMAGDIAAREIGPAGLLALDIANAMPKAMREYQRSTINDQ